MTSYEVVKWRPSWIRHLGFPDFLKTLGNLFLENEIERKVIRTNKGTLIWAKNIKVTKRKVIYLHSKTGFSIF